MFDAAPVTNLDGSANPLVLTATDRFTESDGAPLSTPQFIFIADDPVDVNGDGIISLLEGDTNNDGVVNDLDGECLGDTCVEQCSGLSCRRGGVNTTPIRTFWLQESIE